MKEFPCPCGTEKTYKNCCKRYHEGENAESALILMRSRYSAYALHLIDYIIRTTHPLNPNFSSDINHWKSSILYFSTHTHFDKLDVLDFKDGEKYAFVTFTAHLTQNGNDATFTETSRFEKINGAWLYRDGKISKGKINTSTP
jgi:SEC-C motif domain protein